jgi:hypothetical protein
VHLFSSGNGSGLGFANFWPQIGPDRQFFSALRSAVKAPCIRPPVSLLHSLSPIAPMTAELFSSPTTNDPRCPFVSHGERSSVPISSSSISSFRILSVQDARIGSVESGTRSAGRDAPPDFWRSSALLSIGGNWAENRRYSATTAGANSPLLDRIVTASATPRGQDARKRGVDSFCVERGDGLVLVAVISAALPSIGGNSAETNPPVQRRPAHITLCSTVS